MSRPLPAYGLLAGAYNVALLGFLARRRRGSAAGPLPERIGAGDLVLTGVATHKLSRLIAKDKVTAPLRAPFAEHEADAGRAEVSERVRGEGLKRAVGELLTCPYCLGQWIATGFAIGLVEAPRQTRFMTTVFTAVAIADFLQVAYKAAESRLD